MAFGCYNTHIDTDRICANWLNAKSKRKHAQRYFGGWFSRHGIVYSLANLTKKTAKNQDESISTSCRQG